MPHLILPPRLINQIRAGKKTQHRHPTRASTKLGVTLPCPYRPGEAIAILSAAKIERPDQRTSTPVTPGDKAPRPNPLLPAPDFHIQLTTAATVVDMKRLTQQDAIAEGHKTRADFIRAWYTAHPSRRADLLEQHADDDDTLTGQFLAQQAGVQVWVLTFAICESPRYLAARPDSLQAAYTTDPRQAMRNEPEAVDDATLEKIREGKLMTAAQRRHAEHLQAQRELRETLLKLKPLAAEDKRVADRVRLIERNLDAINAIVSKKAA